MQHYALCGLARLHLPPCKTKALSESRKPLKYILPPIISVILFSTAVIFLWANKKRSVESPQNELSLPQEWRRVSYRKLPKATDDFSENNLLGTGSFGSVFSGTLPDGSNIAVKVFHLQSEGAMKSFESECEILASIGIET